MDAALHLVKSLIRDPVTTINTFQWETGVTPFSSIYSPIIASAGYLILIFSLQHFMKNRKEVKLHTICIVHNLFLSALSVAMFLGVVVPILTNDAPKGIYHTICQPTTKGPVEFWYYIFYLSKVYEFLDTVFLVLRKKSLLFLHVYHHFITFWLCWVNLVHGTTVQFADISINCFVHIIMYYYYYKVEVGESPWWKKYITRIQIFQFVYDITFHCIWRYYYSYLQKPCGGTLFGTGFSDFVILSFLGLFVQFYFRSYSKPRPKPIEKTN